MQSDSTTSAFCVVKRKVLIPAISKLYKCVATGIMCTISTTICIMMGGGEAELQDGVLANIIQHFVELLGQNRDEFYPYCWEMCQVGNMCIV